MTQNPPRSVAVNSGWLEALFRTAKPIVAMCHLQPLPGDPAYDATRGMRAVVESARRDLHALQRGGVDGVMFSNEFSLPYLTKVRPETTAAMARVIGELLGEIEVPFGVNVLWDPMASLDLAAGTGARFVREVMSGVYASDFGLWNPNPGEILRHKARLGIPDVKLLFNIVPEAATYLAKRDVAEVAKTTVFNHRPDAVCVSGITAGAELDSQTLLRVRDAIPTTVVFSNTGCRARVRRSQRPCREPEGFDGHDPSCPQATRRRTLRDVDPRRRRAGATRQTV